MFEDVVGQVRQRRKALGWSQQKLADKAGVTKPTIVNLEKGHFNPRLSTLQKITKALDNA